MYKYTIKVLNTVGPLSIIVIRKHANIVLYM